VSNIPSPQEENQGIRYKGKYYKTLDEINDVIAAETGQRITWNSPQTAPTTGRYATPSGETRPYLAFTTPKDDRSIEQQRLDHRQTMDAYKRWQQEQAKEVTVRPNVWIAGDTPVINMDRVSFFSKEMGASTKGSVGFELEFTNNTTQEFAGMVGKDIFNLFRHPFIWLRENVGKPYIARPAMYIGDKVAPEAFEDLVGQAVGGVGVASSWVYDEFFKPMIRNVSSALMLPIELIENFAMVGSDLIWREYGLGPGYEASEASVTEMLKSLYANTTIYQSGLQSWRTRNFKGGEGQFAFSPSGEGFFPSGMTMEEKNKYEEFIRPKIYGQTATVGRATWKLLADTGLVQAGDDVHSLLTGATDASFIIFTDPLNYIQLANYYKGLGVIADLPTSPATTRQLRKLADAGVFVDPELWKDANKAQEALQAAAKLDDEAIEMLQPKPNIIYSGDSVNTSVPITRFTDLDDPNHVRNHDNMLGQGLYGSDAPYIGSSYTPGGKDSVASLPDRASEQLGGLGAVPNVSEGQGIVYKLEITPEMTIIDSELPFVAFSGKPWGPEAFFDEFMSDATKIEQIADELVAAGIPMTKESLSQFIESTSRNLPRSVEEFIQYYGSRTLADFASDFPNPHKHTWIYYLNDTRQNGIIRNLSRNIEELYPQVKEAFSDAIRNLSTIARRDYANEALEGMGLQVDYLLTQVLRERALDLKALDDLIAAGAEGPMAAKAIESWKAARQSKIDSLNEVLRARHNTTFEELSTVLEQNEIIDDLLIGYLPANVDKSVNYVSDVDAALRIFESGSSYLRNNANYHVHPYISVLAQNLEVIPLQQFGDVANVKNLRLQLDGTGLSFQFDDIPGTVGYKDGNVINDWFMTKGVDGMRYDGGKRIGGFGSHNAYVFFRPSKMKILETTTGEMIPTNQAIKLFEQGTEMRNVANSVAQAKGFRDAAGLVESGSQAAPDLTRWEFFKTTGRYKNLSTYLAAENNPYEIWRTALKRRSPELAVKLAGAQSTDEITRLLNTAVYDPDPLNYLRQLPGWSGNMVSEAGFRIKQTVSRQSNIFANMPRTPFIALDDLDEGARHLDDLMQVLNVPFEMRTEWMNKFLRAASITDNQVRKQTLFRFAGDWEKAIIQQRLQPLVQKLMLKRGETYASSQAANDLREFVNRVSRWRGRELDQTRVWVGDDMMNDVPLPYLDGDGLGPALTSELFNSNIYLIDPEDLDEVAKLFNMWSETIYSLRKYPGFYQAGKAREFARTTLLDAMGLWKSGVLFGLRYTTRVVADEAMRVSMSGQFRGPFSYVSEILSGRLNVDTLGRALPRANEANNLLADITNITRLKEEFATALAAGDDILAGRLEKALNKIDAKVQKEYPKLWEQYGDSQEVLDFRLTEVEIMLNDDGVTALDAMIGRKPGSAADVALRESTPGYLRTRIQKIVDREKNPQEWQRGLADEIAGLSTEPDVREVARALMLGGDEQALDQVAEWMFSGKGRKYFEQYYKGVDKKAGYNWDTLAEAKNRVGILRGMILRATGGNEDVIAALSRGTIADEFGNQIPMGVRTSEGPIADRLLRKFLREGTPDSAVPALYADPRAPQRAAFFPSIPVAEQKQKRQIFGWWMQMTYGKTSDKIARVPLFQALKWNKIADMIPMLSKEEGTRLANIVADLDLPEALKARVAANIDRAGVGTMTVETLDQFAGAWALEDNVNLLFDASKRSLFARQHAFLFPFFDAYRETGATLLKLGLNPQNIHKVDIARQGLQNFRVGGPGETMLFGERDTNMDGKTEGMLYTDPNTGKQVIAAPLVGSLAAMWSDIPFRLAIPVSGLTMQSNVIPGVGPVVALTYEALPFNEDWALLNRLIFPFGSPGERTVSEYFIPTFAQRIVQGAISDTSVGDALKGLFGDPKQNEVFKFSHSRAMQVFAGTRVYPPGERGITQLAEESYDAALKLWFMRGLSQFFLPAAPITQYYAEVDKKLIPLGMLLDDIRNTEIQTLKNGGTIADSQEIIVNKWGDFIVPYLASLSTSTRAGSEPSNDFEQFRAKNDYLFKQYPAAAGLFHQSTGGYELEAYDLQRRIGEREYLPPKELARSIDGLMGGILYRRYENNLPVELRNTPLGRAILSLKASEVRQAFPYWNPSAYAAERESEIRIIVREIEEASRDPRLANTPLMPSLQEYLGWRNEIIKSIRTNDPKLSPDGWKTAQVGILERELLFQEGQRIATENPAFRNMWDNLLSREFQRLTPEDMDALMRRTMPQGVTSGG